MIEEPVSSKELRVFGLGAGAILLALPTLATILRRSERSSLFFVVPLALGALLVLLGAFFPGALRPVYRRWMVFARAIAQFNTLVLLTVAFYLVLAPIGLLLKLIQGDPMERQMKPGTYWRKPRPHSLGARHFERQF